MLALVSDRHGRDDQVELVRQESRDHAVPLLTVEFDLGTEVLANRLGDIDIVALQHAVLVAEIEGVVGTFGTDSQGLCRNRTREGQGGNRKRCGCKCK